MNVLSLFDGMSCGRIALERAGIPVMNYFASEIDKYAIAISKHNYPDIIQVGDVTKISGSYFDPVPDLIIGGSPCQGFSFAGKGLNFDDPRSKLFFEFVRILKEVRIFNPNVLFLLENVKMKQNHEDVISNALQCEPAHINSNLVSAQNRERVYWSNFFCNDFKPQDKCIHINDILENENNEKIVNISNYNPENKKNYIQWDVNSKGHKSQDQRAYYTTGKFGSLPHSATTTKIKIAIDNTHYRNLTTTECERLQTVPDFYTQNITGINKSRSLGALGNGWTIDIISHIFTFLDSSLTTERRDHSKTPYKLSGLSNLIPK